jgi:hypothetical protein
MDHLLVQLGEEPCNHDIGIKSVLHKKVLAFKNATDNSPSKLSRGKNFDFLAKLV